MPPSVSINFLTSAVIFGISSSEMSFPTMYINSYFGTANPFAIPSRGEEYDLLNCFSFCSISGEKGEVKRSAKPQSQLHIKPKMHHIPVLDDVIFAFLPEEAAVAGPGIAAAVKQDFPVDDFGFDKAAFKVRMNHACGLRGFCAGLASPGFGFFWPGSDESD